MDLVTLRTIEAGLDGLRYTQLRFLSEEQESVVHVIRYGQQLSHLKLVVSKTSEALHPNAPANHVGEGGTMSELVASQPDLRFAVNGTFNHYRKGFYNWPHDGFQIGDPVGLVKIRGHYYDDHAYLTANGYLESVTGQDWRISEHPDQGSKYILSSRPILLWEGKPVPLPADEMVPVEAGMVNPPSFLGHGLQRHARTAVGVDGKGNLVFIVVEGEGAGESAGVTLLELQKIGEQLALVSMLNLDGGGSSRFWMKAEDGSVRENQVAPEDEERVLGNVLMLFSTNR